MIDDKPVKAEAMTLTQLAAKYKVCPRTVKKWLADHADTIGRPKHTYIFTPDQVKKIYEILGEP